MTYTIEPSAGPEEQTFGEWTENQSGFCGNLEYKLTLKLPQTDQSKLALVGFDGKTEKFTVIIPKDYDDSIFGIYTYILDVNIVDSLAISDKPRYTGLMPIPITANYP